MGKHFHKIITITKKMQNICFKKSFLLLNTPTLTMITINLNFYDKY